MKKCYSKVKRLILLNHLRTVDADDMIRFPISTTDPKKLCSDDIVELLYISDFNVAIFSTSNKFKKSESKREKMRVRGLSHIFNFEETFLWYVLRFAQLEH